eukprot:jgi/Ulvmu1/585/UM001_0593.1
MILRATCNTPLHESLSPSELGRPARQQLGLGTAKTGHCTHTEGPHSGHFMSPSRWAEKLEQGIHSDVRMTRITSGDGMCTLAIVWPQGSARADATRHSASVRTIK